MSFKMLKESQGSDYKVSVIIPVFNVEDYLTETAQSVLDQTLDGIEIIFVNDGSTDGSSAVIESLLNHYRHITYLEQVNQGPSQARNLGIDQAKGAYICFLDSDDLLPKAALEVMYQAAVNEQADLITGASISFNSKRTWYIYSHSSNGVYNPGAKTLVTHPELLYSVGPCNKMYKRELIKDLRFPQGIKVTEDHPFVIEAYLRANKIYTVDAVIYKYRRRESTANYSLSQGIRTRSIEVLKDIMASLQLTDQLWDIYLKDQDLKQNLRIFYYNRLIQSDIWPSVIHSLKTVSKSRDAILLKVCEWAVTRDPNLMAHFSQRVPSTIKKWNALQKAYRTRSFRPLSFRIFIDRCWKLKSVIQSVIKQRFLYKFAYFFYTKKKLQKKVLFVSTRVTRLNQENHPFINKLKMKWPNHQLVLHLQGSKGLSGSLNYLNDLATSKIVVVDAYSHPFTSIVKRPGIKLIEAESL